MDNYQKKKGGRPRKPLVKLGLKDGKKPLEFLLAVMNDPEADAQLRVRAAVAAAQYVHVKRDQGGKKDEQIRGAQAVLEGKFAPAAAPKLVVNNAK